MKTVLVCLHGWGGSKESFAELREALKGAPLTILTPDLPGFGDEPEPAHPFTVDDYAEWVEKWICNKLQATSYKLFLLGHSHGGRIALKIATRKKIAIDHLFLCAAAGIREARHFKRIVGLTLAKSGKFFLKIPGLKHLQPLGKAFLYKLVRVHDYEKASPVMRETMIKVTAEDLRPLLKNIKVSTDIFWGEDDGMTPVRMGKLMHREISGSTLHLYPGVRHKVHKDRAREIAGVVRAANSI